MSLFHVQEWYRTEAVDGARSITVAQLYEHRDQIIVGTLKGSLWVFDPAKKVDQRQETSLLIQVQLGAPVLQVAAGQFLTAYDHLLIAVLQPHALVYLRLNATNAGEVFELEPLWSGKLGGPPAFNMCQGQFGKSAAVQTCIQSINCSLAVYEGENRVLARQFDETAAIHPGPIDYSPFSDSLLTTSTCACLCSVRYNTLTAASSKKKIQADWELNLGDEVLELAVIGIVPIQPSIVVLCKRSLHCVTHGGSPRFVVRFQFTATTMLVMHDENLSHDAGIRYCVGTSTNTLLLYHDTRVLWTSQLAFVPCVVRTCVFKLGEWGRVHRRLLAILSDECRLVVAYLGTEPSLFRMPATEARFIDFEMRKQELKQLEEAIRHSEGQSAGNEGGGFGLRVDVSIDQKSAAYDSKEGVPSATATISLENVLPASMGSSLSLSLQGDIYFADTHFTVDLAHGSSVPVTLFCKEEPVVDLRCHVVAVTSRSMVAVAEFRVPLELVCRKVAAQKAATNVKLSIDSTGEALDMAALFPEFHPENQTSLGLQPFCCVDTTTVSIFIAPKTGRYRLQSTSVDFMCVVFDELVARIRRQQPNTQLHCSLPFPMFLSEINRHVELEKRRDTAEGSLNQAATLIRHVETVLLNKLKSDRETVPPHMTALVNYSYQSLMTAMEEAISPAASSGSRTTSMRSLLSLMKSVLSLSNIQLPFDGTILDGTDQKLGERIHSLLSRNQSASGDEYSVAEIGNLLVGVCQQDGGTLSGITEEDEEDTRERKEVKDGEEHETTRDGYDFVDLKTGSLAAKLSE